MLVRGRIVPMALILGVAIMVAALTYVTLNRNHVTVPQPPMHQSQ